MQLDAQQSFDSSQRRVQVCTKLVMDTTDPDITFDKNGVCNYWHEFQAFKATQPNAAERDRLLCETLEAVKAAGRGKQYDCVLGLSGGVDSSYIAYLASKFKLRPLVVHFDNGWNSELAVSNIEKLVSGFGFDLETFVMDWDEFRDIQRAYFKASVIDLEVPTDHMILGALHKITARNKIRFMLSGTNQATEWLLPRAWYYRKFDLVNLKAIHRAFGERPIRRLPALGVWEAAYYHSVRRISNVPLLDLVDYNKADAKQLLIDEVGWRDYGGKHYESVFTRFYQGYILPRKFGVDKRKAHLSSLILSGQMDRDEALRELQQPTYDEEMQQRDKEYVAKKLGFTAEEFDAVLTQPNRPHDSFDTDEPQRRRYFQILETLKPVRNMFRGPKKD